MYVRKFCMYALQEDRDELLYLFFNAARFTNVYSTANVLADQTRGWGGAYRIGRLRRPSDDVLSLILTFSTAMLNMLSVLLHRKMLEHYGSWKSS